MSGIAGAARAVAGRLIERPEYVRLVVITYDAAQYAMPPRHERAMQRAARRLQLTLVQVFASDTADLDAITAIDEWKITKEWSLKSLAEGWRCYAAKHEGRIVAVLWAIVGASFRDDALERTLVLAKDEVYFSRAYTIPEYRGRGAMTILGRHAMRDLEQSANVRHGISVARATNAVMLNTFATLGGTRSGSLGFVGLFGARLHFLWGARAFPSTRPRFYVDLRRYAPPEKA